MREKLTVSTWFARATIRYIFAFWRDAICRGDLERAEESRFLREGGSRTGQEASRCSLGRLRILFRRDGEIPARWRVILYGEKQRIRAIQQEPPPENQSRTSYCRVYQHWKINGNPWRRSPASESTNRLAFSSPPCQSFTPTHTSIGVLIP